MIQRNRRIRIELVESRLDVRGTFESGFSAEHRDLVSDLPGVRVALEG